MLYFNTIRRLKPIQIVSRLRKVKVVSLADMHSPGTGRIMGLSIPCLDCDNRYRARFDIDALSHNEFFLINERHKIDFGKWSCPEASRLWNFNLHYFEYCVPLAARYAEEGNYADFELFKKLVSTWIDSCTYPVGDAWHPYTISLRLVNWLICVDLFSPALREEVAFFSKMQDSMYLQYKHLLLNQETHLLANHYLENLKTLLICAMWFDEVRELEKIQGDFFAQLDEQILSDGVHYERSMMYHKLVLEGLLRVVLAYRANGETVPSRVVSRAKLMLDTMVSIEKGMGKTPFFNDSADGVAKECRQLELACKSVLGLDGDDSRTEFKESGFYKLYSGDIAVVFFAGEPGPSFMLGHAHCDLLSFELSIAGNPVVVNAGTYAYQNELRPYFRSTEAHNTVMVEGEEQMECWGEHRVAKGVKEVGVDHFSGNAISAHCTTCSGSRFRRRLLLENRVLQIEDKLINGGSGVPFRAVLHFAPGIDASCPNDGVLVMSLNDLSIRLSVSGDLVSRLCHYSPEFGSLCAATSVCASAEEGSLVKLSFEKLRVSE